MGTAPSNVSVRVESPGTTVTELCVDDDCERADRVGVSADGGVYSFRATVADADGRVVVHSGEVTTFRVEPNGEGCGTRAYGQVVIVADGTATTVDPWVAVSGG